MMLQIKLKHFYEKNKFFYSVRYKIISNSIMSHTNLNQFFTSDDYDKILNDDSVIMNNVIHNGSLIIKPTNQTYNTCTVVITDVENIKYYDGQDNLIFDGTCQPINPEHLSINLRNGMFYENNQLVYDGDLAYCVGQIVYHGIGKGYRDDKLYYEGEWRYNECHGEGTAYENDVMLYYGHCTHNQRNGYGRGYKNNQLVYDGQWKNDERNGHGTQYNNGVVYEGEWEHNMYSGEGKTFRNGQVTYNGNFYNSSRHGHGKEYQSGNLIYEGQWFYGMRHGQGSLYENNVVTQSGTWKYDSFDENVVSDENTNVLESIVEETSPSFNSNSSNDSDDSDDTTNTMEQVD